MGVDEARGDWYRAEIRKRDTRIAGLEQQLRYAVGLLQGAVYLMKRWGYKPAWLAPAEEWLAARPP